MSNGWLTLLQGAAGLITSGKLVELAQTAEEITKVAPTIVSQIEGLLRPIKENRAATGEELAAAVRVIRANDAALKAATEAAEKNT